MPELPDITIYVEHLQASLVGKKLLKIRIASPFLVRSVEPPLAQTTGKVVTDIHRIGKQIVWELEEELCIVIHLMIAGRFHWRAAGAKTAGKINLAAFDFSHGTLMLTEAASKKRASLHLTKGRESLRAFDRGGIDVFSSSLEQFQKALQRENHTLKRALTDPRLFSGIGNAYSDEILHASRLSPLQQTKNLESGEVERLHAATREVLKKWIDLLREQAKDGFPGKVTAFRPEMAVHGKFRQPCPVCATRVQRIRYADNECNYCPRCQTNGRLLSDRSLSRLLRGDWPQTIEA